ncbi:RING finger domain-containing protein [Aspergillus avenaceus]|uniref:RING finger domain-containing protein n=1 Tax=Aspergillus avenaceus TaxID=36643 RepID=A0A5N6TGC4_ASPAV|nr:RING finger domain-containing protein [Aspergillus avenaceus]
MDIRKTRTSRQESTTSSYYNTSGSVSKRKRKVLEDTNATPTSVKRHRNGAVNQVAVPARSVEVIDLTRDSPPGPAEHVGSARRRTKKSPDGTAPERRARVFRKHPPKSYLERLARATTQRMFVVGHTVTGADDVPQMNFDIVGTTGNMYKTVIGKVPSCDCPDASSKGNQCKHICYVLDIVLKAPQHLQYQLAFLSTELREIFQASSLSREVSKSEDNGGRRKAIDGDCPICFMEFEPDKEEIIWCQAACGNNVHKTCFQQWASTQRTQGVRCVYCRSQWQMDTSDVNLEQLKRQGRTNAAGYTNVASQMGLSGRRDYSTYHPYWVSRQLFRYGSRRREND